MSDTAPNFRALCAELAVDLEEWMVATDHRPPSSVELLNRARAALATLPPEPPTDEELDELWDEEARYFNLYEEARRFARAVLGRWGQ